MFLDIDTVPVEDDETYRLAGVYSFARGLFERDALQGRATSYAKFHRLREGQFVLSRLKAWEGAMAPVTADFAGAHLSTEFPTFVCDPEALLPEYAWLMLQRPSFWQTLKGRSSGMGGRKTRVKAEAFLSVSIDLPPLAVQRRIVDVVDHLDAAAAAASLEAASASRALASARRNLIADSQHPRVELASVASLKIGRTPPRKEPTYWGIEAGEVPFLSISDMPSGGVVGVTTEWVTKRAVDEGKAKVFPAGALLMSFKLTIGRTCVTARPLATNEAIVWIDPDTTRLTRDYLQHALAVSDLTSGQNPAVKGATLNKSTLSAITVPLATTHEQGEVVELLAALERVATAAAEVTVRFGAARASLLAELLVGLRDVPTEYDRFLQEVAA